MPPSTTMLGMPGPAAAGPLARRVAVVLARGPAAAEPHLPEHVEALGRRTQAVEAARVVAEEGADLDAVAGRATAAGPAARGRRSPPRRRRRRRSRRRRRARRAGRRRRPGRRAARRRAAAPAGGGARRSGAAAGAGGCRRASRWRHDTSGGRRRRRRGHAQRPACRAGSRRRVADTDAGAPAGRCAPPCTASGRTSARPRRDPWPPTSTSCATSAPRRRPPASRRRPRRSSAGASPPSPPPRATRSATSGPTSSPDGSPHVVVTAHSDQIGLIVTYVDEQGYVSFDKIGGVDAQLLPGRNLVVHGAGGPVQRRRRPQALAQDDRRGARQGAGPRTSSGSTSAPRTRDEALAARADRRPDHLPRPLPAAGQRALRLAGLRQPGRRLRVRPRPRALRGRPRGGAAHGPHHGARGDHVHGRQGHGRALAARRDHRRRRGLRQRRPRHGRQEARRRGQARRRAGDPPRRRPATRPCSTWRARWPRPRASRCRSRRCPARTSTDAEEFMASGRRRRCRSASRCATCTRRSRSCSPTTPRPARCSPPRSRGASPKAGTASASCRAPERRHGPSRRRPGRGLHALPPPHVPAGLGVADGVPRIGAAVTPRVMGATSLASSPCHLSRPLWSR